MNFMFLYENSSIKMNTSYCISKLIIRILTIIYYTVGMYMHMFYDRHNSLSINDNSLHKNKLFFYSKFW